MKWVTREFIHLDRVASPWLIRRFVDPKAEFVFVPWGKEDTRPADAIPFAIPGAELGPHDEHGTTFEKIVRKYKLTDPALALMGHIFHDAIAHPPKRDQLPSAEGIGIYAISEGMLLTASNDLDDLDRSMALYDAIYAYCKQKYLIEADPSLGEGGFARLQALRPKIKAALKG